jgi:hypothetical protein
MANPLSKNQTSEIFIQVFVFLIFLLAVGWTEVVGSQCVPTQAYFSGVADDALTIWINGNQLNTAAEPITYIDRTSTVAPPV